MGPEATIQKKILTWLRKRPGSFTRKIAQGPYAGAGMPDILFVENGTPYFFEVKAEKGRATPLQQRTIEDLKAAGAIAVIVRSVDEVEAVLRREDALK